MAQSGTPKQPSPPPARPSLDADTLVSLCVHIGMGHLKIIGDQLCKDTPITIEFNSIATGYIIDRLAERFANQGIHDYLIEVTGEIRAAGEKPAAAHHARNTCRPCGTHHADGAALGHGPQLHGDAFVGGQGQGAHADGHGHGWRA